MKSTHNIKIWMRSLVLILCIGLTLATPYFAAHSESAVKKEVAAATDEQPAKETLYETISLEAIVPILRIEWAVYHVPVNVLQTIVTPVLEVSNQDFLYLVTYTKLMLCYTMPSMAP